MKRINKVVYFILFFIFSFSSVVKAVNPNIIKSKNFKFTNDKEVVLKGVNGSNIFFFDIDNNAKVNKSYLNLVISQSKLLDDRNSTLTIYINNSPVTSFKLSDYKRYKSNIKIDIPLENIKYGSNEIKISSYRRISDKPCTDDMNKANWVKIHKESYLHINYSDKKDSKSIGEYPYPYIKLQQSKAIDNEIIIPDNFKNSHISSALILSSNFGQNIKFDNIRTSIYKFSESINKKDKNLIYITGTKNIPKEILILLSDSEIKFAKDNAIIKEVQSPYNKEKNILLIVSDNDKNLIKASKLLCYKDLTSQIRENTFKVNHNVNLPKLNSTNNKLSSFKDLGYEDIKIEGLFRHEVSYVIPMYKDKSIKDSSKIVLKYKYSDNLNFDKSLINVYINDTPVTSKKLSKEARDNGVLQVKIPKEFSEVNNFEIKISFDLYVKNEYCDFRDDNSPWGFISKDSYVKFDYGNKKTNVFENYPGILTENNNSFNTTIVIPDKVDSRLLTYISNIIGYIGHDIENIDNINIVKNKEFSEEKYKDTSIIAIGTPNNNLFIKDLNRNLNLKFNNEYTGLISDDKMNFIGDYDKNLATFQLIESPYKKGNNIMVVSSTSDRSIYYGQKYLSDLSLIEKLKGNVVTVDKNGNVRYAYYGEEYKIKDGNSKSDFISKINNIDSNLKKIMLFTVFILTLVIGAVIFIIRKHKNIK
ncbi:cellulose biosynthesis cyclic di-GMP-binding regulatory protein BcsB [Clostridium oceanicum]|uniref:Cellulose biosynthesis cyclic di-GMP-binding regulatory protein BcsB n=1 Tax=Clostridium oceanicum TaxID=1543 RepID=A0ABN1JR88_9CLOT